MFRHTLCSRVHVQAYTVQQSARSGIHCAAECTCEPSMPCLCVCKLQSYFTIASLHTIQRPSRLVDLHLNLHIDNHGTEGCSDVPRRTSLRKWSIAIANNKGSKVRYYSTACRKSAWVCKFVRKDLEGTDIDHTFEAQISVY